MKRAIVVIGAAFGDEGKGLLTDYFCRQDGGASDTIVVRFNGGAQAGHTVVTPDGLRHVFHHFGAGTLAGARTYLSKYFLVNPIVWAEEHQELEALKPGMRLRLFVDHEAPVTTLFDMVINQAVEAKRGIFRHGSCGAGIHETMQRHKDPRYRIVAGDIEAPGKLRCRVRRIYQDYVPERLLHHGLPLSVVSERMVGDFVESCRLMAQHTNMRDLRHLAEPGRIVFEGAQGLLLDRNRMEFFPHVTDSNTGLTNVIKVCHSAGISGLDVAYVTRSYLTRHGAGVLPGESAELSYHDNTNAPNEWQETMRFAPMDGGLVTEAIDRDLNAAWGRGVHINPGIAITHLDQPVHIAKGLKDLGSLPHCPVLWETFGPTADHVRPRTNR